MHMEILNDQKNKIPLCWFIEWLRTVWNGISLELGVYQVE